ncbi:MAG: DegT/DnrJ/EryC1/StrS family aminotransferase, partial [Candidatus Wolfebacteria bacterium]|nr:DegT/DnrJ/EryC1/StrS family aminotransferase [Candidatus Wolfebacteria bacterium]
MIDSVRRKEILGKGKPEPKHVPWWGEPNFGAWYTESEVSAAVDAIRESMDWWIGFGPNSKTIDEFENAFAKYCDAKYAIALANCGVALDIAMMCLDLKPGDEIICPAINFKASQMAVLGQGGKVIFCDIDPRTLNVDLEDVEKRITPRTRAILPVHMNGLSAPMDELLDIAERNPHFDHGPIKVIGDAARSCGAEYKGKKIGSKGWLTTFSFNGQKLMTTLGEGGAITTDDKNLADRIRSIRSYGGENGWGSNYRMNKIQAAVGLVQLERLDDMNQRRREAAQRRIMLLRGVPEIQLPVEPSGYKHLYYVFGILVPPDWAGEKRNKILSIMENRFGIVCSITNLPTYQRWPYIAARCGVPKLNVSEN